MALPPHKRIIPLLETIGYQRINQYQVWDTSLQVIGRRSPRNLLLFFNGRKSLFLLTVTKDTVHRKSMAVGQERWLLLFHLQSGRTERVGDEPGIQNFKVQPQGPTSSRETPTSYQGHPQGPTSSRETPPPIKAILNDPLPLERTHLLSRPSSITHFLQRGCTS